jgi:hypothetical protein
VAEKTDPALVVAAARIHSMLERAHRELGQDDLTIVAANGTLCAHPLVGVINTLTQRARALWADMGLTPKTSKLTDPGDKGDVNGWNDLLVVGDFPGEAQGD